MEDLRTIFAQANEEKSGDQLAGIAARSEQERVAAVVARGPGSPILRCFIIRSSN